MEWLEGMLGVTLNTSAKFIIAFIFVLLLISLTAWVIRTVAAGRVGFRGGLRARQDRLAVVDAAHVDAKRRLILVRRDNVEHLILVGGPTDVVVETAIGAAGYAAAAAERGRAVEPAEPPRPAARAAEPARPALRPAEPVVPPRLSDTVPSRAPRPAEPPIPPRPAAPPARPATPARPPAAERPAPAPAAPPPRPAPAAPPPRPAAEIRPAAPPQPAPAPSTGPRSTPVRAGEDGDAVAPAAAAPPSRPAPPPSAPPPAAPPPRAGSGPGAPGPGAPGPGAAASSPLPAAQPPGAAGRETQLEEMAQRLEAALKRPLTPVAPSPASTTAPPESRPRPEAPAGGRSVPPPAPPPASPPPPSPITQAAEPEPPAEPEFDLTAALAAELDLAREAPRPPEGDEEEEPRRADVNIYEEIIRRDG